MAAYYLDADFMMHIEQNAEESFQLWEDTQGVFDGKCQVYIEGFRVVPEGQAWTRNDGDVFDGLMITPAEDFDMLIAAQRACEEAEVEPVQEEDPMPEADEEGET